MKLISHGGVSINDGLTRLGEFINGQSPTTPRIAVLCTVTAGVRMFVSIGDIIAKVNDQLEMIKEACPLVLQMGLDLVKTATEACGVFASRVYRG